MKKRARINSLRRYRRLIDQVTIEAIEGKRPMSDVAKVAAAFKASGEIFLAEGQLARSGLDIEVSDHQAGIDGGGEDIESRAFVEKRLSFKKGISPKGTEIDETKVEVTGEESQVGFDMIKDLL